MCAPVCFVFPSQNHIILFDYLISDFCSEAPGGTQRHNSIKAQSRIRTRRLWFRSFNVYLSGRVQLIYLNCVKMIMIQITNGIAVVTATATTKHCLQTNFGIANIVPYAKVLQANCDHFFD